MAAEVSQLSPNSPSARSEHPTTQPVFNASISLETLAGAQPSTSGTTRATASELPSVSMNEQATSPSILSALARRIVSESNDRANGPPGAGLWHSVQKGLVSPNGPSGVRQTLLNSSSPRGIMGKTKPRMVLRVERDYSDGQTCQFCCDWIDELKGRVTRNDFESMLNGMNAILASAHDPYRSIVDNCCAILTFYLSPKLFPSHFAKCMREFDRVLERANREIYNPVGLNLLPPRRTAFLFMEIEYY
ncbi:hypothetical protein MVLG_01873 [Microbotryum lychnidis-dioicae p1A1 Lamole]|uniref:Ras modification protein ERF4 n=2 Tax=Microbotryum TaxID=34416 RepID=U5H3F4_USTV1|nr:hypothetical protein MVLG_01873 [Microbotryum lychnidis-dioicae p1A1 Lamole]SGY78838.1 BQ5605_C008g04969 [Microbotryum silenes-dioicae]|eukprot:KDE07967.1 hypothetical protein MVLG_01873 [Microbotryum lychnidis-dioicae p1A1 Lamole]